MNKRIVVCADGTWNRPEKNLEEDFPTNVLRIARAVQPIGNNRMPQQVFYDWGIGSYHDQVSAGVTGKGLHKNIMDNYRYIVQNYSPGDELFLFGFSRGAYTIRSLCGLINNLGILKRPNARLIQLAFEYYKRSAPLYAPGGEEAKKFRKRNSHPSRDIKFVGVWDTVGAMGIPMSFLGFLDDEDEFYDTEIGSNISIARHALAINELRRDFRPTVWSPKEKIDMRQVWFIGAHSDVGGSYAPDAGGGLLSDIPLAWMMRQAQNAGLTLEPHLEPELNGKSSATLHQSRRSFYRIKRKFYRAINHGKGSILIHKSVKERWDSDPEYQQNSINLARYLRENGWPEELES